MGEVALVPLIELLKNKDAVTIIYAATALRTITGKDFGPNYSRWEKYLKHGAQQKKKPLAEYLFNASQFVNFRGDEESAERELLEAIKQYPGEAEAHYVYGNFLYNFFRKRRGLDQAEKELRIAIKLNSKHGRAHYDLGRVLAEKGLQEEAKHEFDAASSLGVP